MQLSDTWCIIIHFMSFIFYVKAASNHLLLYILENIEDSTKDPKPGPVVRTNSRTDHSEY